LKILLVVAYFKPEIGSASHLYFDLAKAFVDLGHNVNILTSYPRSFNLNENDVGKTFPLVETIDGINIYRCRHPTQRDNIVLRGLEHFIIPHYYFKLYKQLNIKFDVCLMYIPPLPLYYLARKIKKYDNTRSVLNLQDFHPQELIDVGVIKNPVLIKFMEFIEREAYKNADFITVLSRGGVNYIVKRGADPNKIKHIFNGLMFDDFKQYKEKNDFKEKQDIVDKILVTYVGILSPYQGIDNILNVAIKLRENDDIVFYIVGDGSNKKHLSKRINKEKISNVKMLPFQSREEYFNIINSSDISLVSLDERMKAPCLPGKIKDLLAMNQPIIASVSLDSETAYVIKEAGGIVIDPGDIEDMTKVIIKLKNNLNRKKKMGNKGWSFFKKNMDLKKIVKYYEQILLDLKLQS